MSEEDERCAAWIDYVIASADPIDRTLLDEFRDQAWKHGQLMQFITADPANINAETYARMEEGQDAQNELQRRISARGAELQAGGHEPADEETFRAWRATWVPLASHIASDDGPLPRA